MATDFYSEIGDLFLTLSLKKPKENQCFGLRTFENARKIYVFAPRSLPEVNRERLRSDGIRSISDASAPHSLPEVNRERLRFDGTVC